MKVQDVTQCLKALGWSTRTDEAGDKVAYVSLLDRRLEIIYGIRKFKEDQQLEIMPSISSETFSKACETIDIGHGGHAPLVVPFMDTCIRVPEILEEHVRQASDGAIAWAKEQDLDKALHDYAALPTSAPGARPIWHLGALVVLGEVERLKSYKSSFEAGDRLGFVNYVTEDYIDRAVELVVGSASPAPFS